MQSFGGILLPFPQINWCSITKKLEENKSGVVNHMYCLPKMKRDIYFKKSGKEHISLEINIITWSAFLFA